MKYKTLAEEIYEEGIAKGIDEGIISFIIGRDKIFHAIKKLGLLTEEQIELVKKQTEIE